MKMKPMSLGNSLRKWFPDAFHLTCLFVVSIFFFREFSSSVYFDFHDESVYLNALITKNHSAHAAWGPIYSMFYWLQSFWQKDPFSLYYQNAVTLSFLLPFSFYWFLRRYEISPFFSGVCSYLFLVSDFNLFLFPKPAHFQLLLIFLYLGFAKGIKDKQHYLISTGIFSLFLMFIRPKMILMPIFFFSLILFLASSKKDFSFSGIKMKLPKYLFSLFLFVFMVLYFGNPVSNREKNSAIFSQNYSLNRNQRQERLGGKLNPVEHSFSGYAKEFSAHIEQNIRTFGDILFSHDFNFPAFVSFENDLSSSSLQLAFLLFSVLLIMLLQRKKMERFSLDNISYFFPIFHSMICLAAASIVYPWARYFFAVILYIPLFFTRFWRTPKSYVISLLCCGLFFLHTVVPLSVFSTDPAFKERQLKVWGIGKSINLLRSVKNFSPGKCLSYSYYIGVYLNNLCSEVISLKDIHTYGRFGLWEQIESEKPDYVFIGWGFMEQDRKVDESFDFRSFTEKVSNYGYRTIVLSLENEEFFLVKYPATGEAR
jgi:hypothetical protein